MCKKQGAGRIFSFNFFLMLIQCPSCFTLGIIWDCSKVDILIILFWDHQALLFKKRKWMSNFSRGISTFTGMITWLLFAGLLQRASDYYVIISDMGGGVVLERMCSCLLTVPFFLFLPQFLDWCAFIHLTMLWVEHGWGEINALDSVEAKW